MVAIGEWYTLQTPYRNAIPLWLGEGNSQAENYGTENAETLAQKKGELSGIHLILVAGYSCTKGRGWRAKQLWHADVSKRDERFRNRFAEDAWQTYRPHATIEDVMVVSKSVVVKLLLFPSYTLLMHGEWEDLSNETVETMFVVMGQTKKDNPTRMTVIDSWKQLQQTWKDAMVSAVAPPKNDNREWVSIDVAGGTGDIAFRRDRPIPLSLTRMS